VNTTVTRAYKYALDPSPVQIRDLERHAGAARFAFNWALAAAKVNLAQRAAERTYGVNEQELTPSLGWNLPALRRAWNLAKPTVAPWWTECSKEAFNTGLDGVARALGNRWATGPTPRTVVVMAAGSASLGSAPAAVPCPP
jgi:putative transposase